MGTLHGTQMAKLLVFTAIVFALNFSKVAGLLILSDSSKAGRALLQWGEGGGDSDVTVRIDPLDNLKKYRGGYNVTNEHYWSSTAFTGIYGYATAAMCLLFGLGYGVFLLVTICCKSSRKIEKRSSCDNHGHQKPLLLASFFTLLVVMASALVFGGNSKFHSRAKTVIDVIIDAADEASSTIYDTTGAMKKMNASLKEVDGSSKAINFLSSTTKRLDTQAAVIGTQASKNRRMIYEGLNLVYLITAATISLTLLVVIALLASGVLKFQRTLQVLIAFCWIFIFLCWLLFGIYFFLQNLAGDTCTALEGFQKDPYNNSFSSILPCDELLAAEPVLKDIKAGIYNLVIKVNENISTSYGSIIQICNPFSSPPMYEYQPWNCPATSVKIGEIPKLLRMLACPDSDGICNGGILVPATYYKSVKAYCSSIQTLVDAYPGIQSLIECQTVKHAFSEILHKHCKPIKRYIRMLCTGLVFLSSELVALVLTWTFTAHHEQSFYSSDGSVTPNTLIQ